MLIRLKKSLLFKTTNMIVFFSLCVQTLTPTVAYALTSGPSQPEASSFSPVGASDLVDPATGDFSYNIPLMDIEGYPLNLIYNAGVSMDQEASWVGLGWNINPGSIVRTVRGLPDDFNGEEVTHQTNMKDNVSISAFGTYNLEIVGAPIGFSAGMGVNYNNYTGISATQTFNINISAGESGKSNMNAGLGLTSGSATGLDVSPSVSFTGTASEGGSSFNATIGVGLNINSREGFTGLTLTASASSSMDNGSHQLKKAGQEDKNRGHSASNSFSNSSSISFGSQTYVPKIATPMKSLAITVSGKIGGESYTVAQSGHFSGSFSRQRIREVTKHVPAFGYLYSENGIDGPDALLDFNREKDGSFSTNSPNLPLTSYTYDVYSVSGQGVGGVYRPFRNDIGTVYDPKETTTSDSYSLGGEVNIGQLVKVGTDINITDVNTKSGKWGDGNPAMDGLKFVKKEDVQGDEPLYESYYFKAVGEKSVETTELYDDFGGDQPVRVPLVLAGQDVKTKNELIRYDHNSVSQATGSNLPTSIPNQNIGSIPLNRRSVQNQMDDFTEDLSGATLPKKHLNERSKRSQPISMLTFEEAEDFAFDRTLYDDYDDLPRDQIAEITVTRPDGTRYVYGLPLVNYHKEEVSFNISGITPDCGETLVSYNAGVDNSPNNKRGVNHYYNRTVTPAFVHSYMLTAIVSADYVDVTGDGISDDDLGTYNLFRYTDRPTAGLFKWRTPVEKDMANFNENMRYKKTINDGDDMASYVYGEKDIRYLKEVESKNYIAIFDLSDREDGYGVTDENGEKNSSVALKKVDAISLYVKREYQNNYNSSLNTTSATPIKTAHFEYKRGDGSGGYESYWLCEGVANNIDANELDENMNVIDNKGGKLTLSSMWFTYGNSTKGELSKYEFEYSSFNPDYSMSNYDRWAGYKPQSVTASSCYLKPSGALTNAEFPYVDQTDASLDEYASAWNLETIYLPSGGAITVSYEADDYAYVQDKQAMEMFTVAGAGSTNDYSAKSEELFTTSGITNIANNYIFIDLHEGIDGLLSNSDANELFKKKYLKGIEHLYFKFLVNLTNSNSVLANSVNNGENYENIMGYAQILSAGVGQSSGSGDYDYAYIELRKTDVKGDYGGSNNANPIAIAAWQYDRTTTPELAYDQPTINEGAKPIAIIKALVGSNMIKNIIEFFRGPNKTLRDKGYGKQFVASRSMLRLNNPNKFKKGGGHRVKRLAVVDAWDHMTANNNQIANYIQQFEYTMEEGDDIISAGVAAYEPVLGGDENPWRQPKFVKEKNLLVPDGRFYVEGPMGEGLFPSPQVVYRKVTIKNYTNPGVYTAEFDAKTASGDIDNDVSTNTGKVVHEFYTAYDFPVQLRETEIKTERIKPDPILQIFKVKSVDVLAASQGYVVELNDMHGKPKAQYVFAQGKDGEETLSGVEYHYLSNGKKLLNNVPVITKNGKVVNTDIGLEYDIIADSRKYKTVVKSGGGSINVDVFLAGIYPVPLPTLFATYSKETTQFKSMVITKVIRRYGLIDETIAFDLSSRISTKNLAYDAETGDVLLTQTKDEFKDDVYNLNYPSHWVYDQMGPAYRNIGVEFTKTVTSGYINFVAEDADKYFVEGDELMAVSTSDGTKHRFWVKPLGVTDEKVYLIDRMGAPPVDGEYYLKVIRSGRRNLQSSSVGSIKTKDDPINTFTTSLITSVLDANAVEYTDQWDLSCDCINDIPGTNEYVTGKRGNWRPIRSHLYLTGRSYAHADDGLASNDVGLYVRFSPFWQMDQIKWMAIRGGWTWNSEITQFSPYGAEIENKDPLEIYSAAEFGYDQSLAKSVSGNAEHSEVGFDGFEDYDYDNCADDHFRFKNFGATITNGRSHTGRNSLKVNAGEQVIMEKSLLDTCPPEEGEVVGGAGN